MLNEELTKLGIGLGYFIIIFSCRLIKLILQESKDTTLKLIRWNDAWINEIFKRLGYPPLKNALHKEGVYIDWAEGR
jgi:hypothetical protein